MSASTDLREVRDSLTRATTELAAATDRLEALESGNVHGATVITRRWRQRDTVVASLSSLGTALLVGLVAYAMPKAEPPPQAIIMTQSAPRPPEALPAPSALSGVPSVAPAPSLGSPPAEPVAKVVEPVPAPLPPVRPVAARKSDAPAEPIRPAHPPDRHEASDVF